MIVVWNDQVSIVLEGFDQTFIHGHDMIFIAVQHIIHVIPSFLLIALDPAAQFYMVLGFNKQLEIQFLLNFFKVLNEQSFHHDNRGGFELQHFWFGQRIVECIFFFQYVLAGFQFEKVSVKGVMVNRIRKVEVRYTPLISGLLITWLVVIVLRDKTDLLRV